MFPRDATMTKNSLCHYLWMGERILTWWEKNDRPIFQICSISNQLDGTENDALFEEDGDVDELDKSINSGVWM